MSYFIDYIVYLEYHTHGKAIKGKCVYHTPEFNKLEFLKFLERKYKHEVRMVRIIDKFEV